MPRKAFTYDIASATVRFPRINADQTTTELTAAQFRAAIKATSCQFLAAGANTYDGSPQVIALDSCTLNVAGFAAPYSFSGYASGQIEIKDGATTLDTILVNNAFTFFDNGTDVRLAVRWTAF